MARHLAYGETKAPQDVDTLRDEACPICGNDTAYAGRECQICGYILPIKPFSDPDVDKAKELDQLKNTVDDQLLAADPSRKGAPMPDGTDLDEAQMTGDDPASPTLACSNCSTEFRPGAPQTTDAPGQKPVEGPAEGDICPECQQGELVSTGQPIDQGGQADVEADPDELDQDADQLPDEDEDDPDDLSNNDEDEDEPDPKDPRGPASKKTKATKNRKPHRSEGDNDAMQGLQAMAKQQELIDAQSAQIAVQGQQLQHQATQIQRLTAAVATLAAAGGDELHGRVRVAMIRKRADEQNPAQPVPEPAPQPSSQSTQEAKTPEAFADVTAPGMVPGSTQDVAADAVTTAYTPGQDVAAAPFRNLVDVTAPIEGTQGPRPINETRTEVDVRAGNPMNPQVAFPVGGPYTQTQRTTGSLEDPSQPPNDLRFVSCLRLARLQIEAGIAEGEDLAIAQRLASDVNRPQDVINFEIQTLSNVKQASAKRQAPQQPPHGLPIRSAGLQRTLPAMASMAGVGAAASNNVTDAEVESIFY